MPAQPGEKDYYEDVYSGLEKLGEDHAQIIRLKHFSQMTFEEIARRLRVSANTVKTRYYRGLIKLREFLDPDRLEERT
jgi:RNA polymerase sigma factor (sigma-70 family)